MNTCAHPTATVVYSDAVCPLCLLSGRFERMENTLDLLTHDLEAIRGRESHESARIRTTEIKPREDKK